MFRNAVHVYDANIYLLSKPGCGFPYLKPFGLSPSPSFSSSSSLPLPWAPSSDLPGNPDFHKIHLKKNIFGAYLDLENKHVPLYMLNMCKSYFGLPGNAQNNTRSRSAAEGGRLLVLMCSPFVQWFPGSPKWNIHISSISNGTCFSRTNYVWKCPCLIRSANFRVSCQIATPRFALDALRHVHFEGIRKGMGINPETTKFDMISPITLIHVPSNMKKCVFLKKLDVNGNLQGLHMKYHLLAKN